MRVESFRPNRSFGWLYARLPPLYVAPIGGKYGLPFDSRARRYRVYYARLAGAAYRFGPVDRYSDGVQIMGIELPYEEPPRWQLVQPSERERLNGVPSLVVILSGETPEDIKAAFSSLVETAGWLPREGY